MVKLINTGNTPITVSLYHEIYCRASGRCKCTVVRGHRETTNDKGVKGLQPQRTKVPGSAHVPAKGELVWGDDAILLLGQIKSAIRSRVLQVVHVPAEVVAPKADLEAVEPVSAGEPAKKAARKKRKS